MWLGLRQSLSTKQQSNPNPWVSSNPSSLVDIPVCAELYRSRPEPGINRTIAVVWKCLGLFLKFLIVLI